MAEDTTTMVASPETEAATQERPLSEPAKPDAGGSCPAVQPAGDDFENQPQIRLAAG